MACRDYDDDCDYDDGVGYELPTARSSLQAKLNGEQKRLDQYAHMLCSQCKILEALEDDDVWTPEVKEWWESHKIADKKREEDEKKKAEAERKKKLDMYNKLKEELGL